MSISAKWLNKWMSIFTLMYAYTLTVETWSFKYVTKRAWPPRSYDLLFYFI